MSVLHPGPRNIPAARRDTARLQNSMSAHGGDPSRIFPGAPYGRPSPEAVDAFGAIVRDANYTVTIRYSKGDDIGAACGQLDGAAAA